MGLRALNQKRIANGQARRARKVAERQAAVKEITEILYDMGKVAVRQVAVEVGMSLMSRQAKRHFGPEIMDAMLHRKPGGEA